MGYSLGIDVGTTFTAAAIWRDERVELVSLESHRVAIPTVIFAEGDEIVFGTAAVTHGATQPSGVAREFKRRLGDAVPLVLAGSPYSADRLVALFAQWVVRSVSEQFGESPDRVVITHPANWTEFQLHLLTNALDQVGLRDAAQLTEPQAAAIDFGAAAHLEPGELVVVYDLGGGTFDVAVLRREHAGFSHVGEPAGVERLGGIDFDEAVFQHIVATVPEPVITQARSDPTGRMALAQLRRSCVEAKETLSNEVAVDIPVVLPGATATVRLTRVEFEAMIRPMLNQTVELVQQVIARNEIAATDLAAVLLVGGSSRVPLVSELVRERIGAAVRVDAHPKLVVARGAARWAGTLPQRPSRVTAARSATSRRRTALIAGGVATLAAAGAAAWFVVAGGDDGGASPDTTERSGSVVTQSTQSTPSSPASTVATTSSSSTASTAPPTLPIGETVAALQPIGTAEVPGGTTVDGHLFGGVTGSTWDPSSDQLLALTDARVGPVEAGLFGVDVDLSDGTLDDGDLTVEAFTPLLDGDGAVYGDEMDGEAIALTGDDTILVLSEGNTPSAEQPETQAPLVHEFDRDGQFLRAWPIPDWYQPDGEESGIRPDGGFNGLTVTGTPELALAAVEYTLFQDEQSPDYIGEDKVARILAYDAASATPIAEFAYPLDPTSFIPQPNPFPSGLLDIVALDGRTMLVLERSLIEEPHTWRLFEVLLDPAAAAAPSAERPPTTLTKRLLQTVDVVANYQSIALGPTLPDGRRSLLVIDDNNFADDAGGNPRRTIVTAYAIDTEPAP